MLHPEFTINHMLLNVLERSPDKVYIVEGDRRFSYGTLERQASSLAHALKQHGIVRDDRVGIYLDKSWEAVVSIMAVVQVGAVFVNIGPLLKEPQVRHIMNNCGVKLLIADADKVEGLTLPELDVAFYRGNSRPECSWAKEWVSLDEAFNSGAECPSVTPANERDLATIIYTSGSTGLPKGIMISHRNLAAGAQIVSSYLENTADDRLICALPINLDYGLNQLTTMLRVGGTVVLQRSLLPGEILKTLRNERITGMAGMPPLWTILLQCRRSIEREPLQHLRYLSNSGGTIPQTNLDTLRDMLPDTKIFLMYGLTEAFRATYLPPEEIDRGPECIGRAIPNTDIRIIDQDGHEVAPGEEGELIQRGPTVALGYWGDEEKTASVYRPNPLGPPELAHHEQVVYSGDLVRRGGDGYLYFLGRRDELIKTQGYRVSPGEVESLLTGIPEVSEAVAFGRHDDMMGQKIVAIVSTLNGADCSSEYIRRSFSENAPHYMVPKDVHIIAELPKTATGKIDRSALKNEYAN